jgi:hypothetical protein
MEILLDGGFEGKRRSRVSYKTKPATDITIQRRLFWAMTASDSVICAPEIEVSRPGKIGACATP